MMVFAIAERLQVPIDTVLDMSVPEFHGWISFSRLMKGNKT
jgi:hypothetical protein